MTRHVRGRVTESRDVTITLHVQRHGIFMVSLCLPVSFPRLVSMFYLLDTVV